MERIALILSVITGLTRSITVSIAYGRYHVIEAAEGYLVTKRER